LANVTFTITKKHRI